MRDIFGLLFLGWLVTFGAIALMSFFKRHSDGWRGVRYALIPIGINTVIWACVCSNVWGMIMYAPIAVIICGLMFYVPLLVILGKGIYLKFKRKERFSKFAKGYIGYSLSFVFSSLLLVIATELARYYY